MLIESGVAGETKYSYNFNNLCPARRCQKLPNLDDVSLFNFPYAGLGNTTCFSRIASVDQPYPVGAALWRQEWPNFCWAP